MRFSESACKVRVDMYTLYTNLHEYYMRREWGVCSRYAFQYTLLTNICCSALHLLGLRWLPSIYKASSGT